jgi:hypothetical protein
MRATPLEKVPRDAVRISLMRPNHANSPRSQRLQWPRKHAARRECLIEGPRMHRWCSRHRAKPKSFVRLDEVVVAADQLDHRREALWIAHTAARASVQVRAAAAQKQIETLDVRRVEPLRILRARLKCFDLPLLPKHERGRRAQHLVPPVAVLHLDVHTQPRTCARSLGRSGGTDPT